MVIIFFYVTGSYLIGSLSTAIILCKILKAPDPRLYGSGNPGATNITRIMGKKFGLITFIGDGVKGGIVVLLSNYLNLTLTAQSLCIAAVFLGHLYPIYFNFKGGKGVATTIGILLFLNVPFALAALTTWAVVFSISKISSLSAIVMSLMLPVYGYYFAQPNIFIVFIFISILLLYSHRSNMMRLWQGIEKPRSK